MEKRQDRNLVRERIHGDLLKLVDNTLSNSNVGPKIKQLLDFTNIGVDELKEEVLSYTLKKSNLEYGNDPYRRIVARLTLHFHNLVEGTYHQQRHMLVSSLLNQAAPKHFIDIGYGVPASYHFSYLHENPDATIALLDQDQSAEDFGHILVANEDIKLLSRIKFQIYDMNTELYPGDADAYLFLDSIEHARKPSQYLNKMVQESGPGAHFIFSLPIGVKEANSFHYAEWLTDDEARNWIENAGLKTVRDGIVSPNPAVDFFAELKKGGFHNYIALAKKA